MADALCHPDDLAGVGISSGWVTANSFCQPDDILFHIMSSGWLNRGWYLIRMSYGNAIMSSGWHTLPFLSHPDEITTFDFPQHAVAFQCFRISIFHNTRWSFIASVLAATLSRNINVTATSNDRDVRINWLPWMNRCLLLRWHHNECHGVSNHQPLHCLFYALFKLTSKVRVVGPLRGKFTGDRWLFLTKGQ